MCTIQCTHDGNFRKLKISLADCYLSGGASLDTCNTHSISVYILQPIPLEVRHLYQIMDTNTVLHCRPICNAAVEEQEKARNKTKQNETKRSKKDKDKVHFNK